MVLNSAWLGVVVLAIFCTSAALATEMLPYRDMKNERDAQWAAAQISGKRGESGLGGIVVLLYTSDVHLRDQVRIGAMQAVDSDGQSIEVLGVIVVPSNRNQFVVYGDGHPASNTIDGKEAQRLSKLAVEQIYEAIVEPGFFMPPATK